MGTRRYLAPEQLSGRIDARCDVWGLGLVLYELLTLRPAFESGKFPRPDPPRPGALVRALPRELEAICLKAIQTDAARRYPTARAFGEDLARWLAREPVQALPARPLRRACLWAVRNKGWAAALAVLFLATLALGVGGLAVGRERAATALARERQQRRALLMQEGQRVRLGAHQAGWSDRTLGLVREAALLQRDDVLRAQAAATLAGLDARLGAHWMEMGASSLVFDRAGNRLLLGGVVVGRERRPGATCIWDVTTRALTDLGAAGPGPVAFFRGQTPVQLVESRGTLALLDLERRRLRTRFVHPGKPTPQHAMLTPDGSRVAARASRADGKDSLVVWDGATGETLLTRDASPAALALAPDGSLVASGDAHGRVEVWSVATGERVATLPSGRLEITALSFQRDPARSSGWLLAVGSAGGLATVWDLGTRLPRLFCHGNPFDTYAVAFSPDGSLLVTTGRSTAHLWDVASGRLLLSVPVGEFASALAVSPDGRRLAVGSPHGFGPGTVHVWDLEPGRGVNALRGLVGYIQRTAFSPDGRQVAALAHDWRIGVWETATGRLIRLLDAPEGILADNAALAFSPDGRSLAFATSGAARLWDLDPRSRGEPRAWALPTSLCDTLAFHASGKLLLLRVEPADLSRGPSSDLSRRDFPRVCRLRDLLAPDPLAPLAELTEFNRGVHAITAPADGSCFVVEGVGGRDQPRRLLKAFDGPTGRELWALPTDLPLTAPANLQVDPSGSFLAAWTSDSGPRPHFSCVALPSGRLLPRALERSIGCLGPCLNYFLEPVASSLPDHSAGIALYRGEGTFLIDLGSDAAVPLSSHRFSPDGRRLAWGGHVGSVFVANLPELRLRLNTLGLGW